MNKLNKLACTIDARISRGRIDAVPLCEVTVVGEKPMTSTMHDVVITGYPDKSAGTHNEGDDKLSPSCACGSAACEAADHGGNHNPTSGSTKLDRNDAEPDDANCGDCL